MEKKYILETLTQPSSGSFAVEQKRMEWVNCRDRIFKLLKPDMNGFYFSHAVDERLNTIEFIGRTEKILNVQPSKFYNTNRNYATYIEPPFWMDCHVKRSLLTLLIRAGFNYNLLFRDYEETLFSEKYLEETKEAMMRFLFGFTKYKSNSNLGWYDSFRHVNKSQIICNLKMPNEADMSKYSLGMGSLWG